VDLKTWLKQARQLRARMFEDEAAFYLFLVDGEGGAVDWRGVTSSFEEAIDGLCDVVRYVSFRNAIGVVDRGCASRIGVDGVIVAARTENKAKRTEIILSFEEHRRHTGVPLSRQEAVRQAQRIAPVEGTTNDLRRAINRDRLEQENVSLRKRCQELEAEVRTLRKELAKLKGTKKSA
jgi:hypothetical protein